MVTLDQIYREIESILSVVEDGEYESAYTMLSSLKYRMPDNHSMAYDIKKAMEVVQDGNYQQMLFNLEAIMFKINPDKR